MLEQETTTHMCLTVICCNFGQLATSSATSVSFQVS